MTDPSFLCERFLCVCLSVCFLVYAKFACAQRESCVCVCVCVCVCEVQVMHPLDHKYSSLNAELSAIASGSEEHKWISKYLVNTQGPTHNAFKLAVHQAFKVCRSGEDDRFTKLHNR